MESEFEKIESHLQKLAQIILIDQFTMEPNLGSLVQPYSLSSSKYQYEKNLRNNQRNNNIGNFLNPFYMTLASKNQNQSQQFNRFIQCITNSELKSDLSNLLDSVVELPKLRYQQSQKKIDLTNTKDPNLKDHADRKEKKIQEAQIQSQKMPQIKEKANQAYLAKSNLSTKMIDQQNDSYKPNLKNSQNQILEFPDLLEHSIFEHSNQIINADEVFKQQKDHIEFFQMKTTTKKKPANESTKNDAKRFQSQSSRKMIEEKNFIQNYFKSAKDRVFQNCSNLNCCQDLLNFNQKGVNSKLISLASSEPIQNNNHKKN